MRNSPQVIRGFLIAILFFISSSNHSRHFHGNDLVEVRQAPGYIFVHNRSYYPVRVLFNGYDVGGLAGGYYNTWTVQPGCYDVRTVWANGYYNYWNACPGYGQTFYCYTN